MSALDFFTRETIVVRTTYGERRVPAWRYGDLAVHRELSDSGDWVVTHTPTGMSFSQGYFVFSGVEAAADATMELCSLRNEWVSLTQTDLHALREKIAAIGRKHGGRRSYPSQAMVASGRKYLAAGDLNPRALGP